MTTKPCKGKFCHGKAWPLSRFGKDKTCKDGHKSVCKMCDANRNVVGFTPGRCERCKEEHDCSFGSGRFCCRQCAANRQHRKHQPPVEVPPSKRCTNTACEFNGELQPIANFYRRSDTGKHRSHCKSCDMKAVRRHQSTFKGYIKNSLASARARARHRGNEAMITSEFLETLWKKQKGCCAISGMKMTHIVRGKQSSNKTPTNGSIDRIDSSKGYTEDNVQWVVNWIQDAKSDYDQTSFEDWIIIAAAGIVKRRSS